MIKAYEDPAHAGKYFIGEHWLSGGSHALKIVGDEVSFVPKESLNHIDRLTNLAHYSEYVKDDAGTPYTSVDDIKSTLAAFFNATGDSGIVKQVAIVGSPQTISFNDVGTTNYFVEILEYVSNDTKVENYVISNKTKSGFDFETPVGFQDGVLLYRINLIK